VLKPKIRPSLAQPTKILPTARQSDEKISKDEIATVNAYLEEHSMARLSIIKMKVLPKRSVASIYKIVLDLNIPVDRPRIIRYFCPHCEMDYNAIYLYFGLTKKPPCPYCGVMLKYGTSLPLTFIGNIDSIYILARGRLTAPREEDHQMLNSFFSMPKKISFIGEIKYSAQQKECFHIVKSVQAKMYTSQCGRAFIRAASITTDQNNLIKREDICLDCSLAINNLLLRNKPLEPLIINKRESKKERMMKIVVAALALENISAASRLYGISRTTIYNYRRKLVL